MEKFDIAVIGGGPGGYSAAIKAAKAKKSVVLFEENLPGGTCLNSGCIPTKALLDMAKRFRHVVEDNSGYITYSDLRFNFSAADALKNSRVAKLRDSLRKYLAANRIELVGSRAGFLSPGVLEAGGCCFKAEHVIIASGSEASRLGIAGLEYALSTDGLTSSIPEFKDVAVIGGGAAGLEFSAFYEMTGAKVSVVFMEDRPLPSCEKDISQGLSALMRKRGISVYPSSSVSAVEKLEDKLSLSFCSGDLKTRIECEAVLDASGRIPRLDRESLDRAGIKYDGGGIEVNAFFETNVKNIYAVGDVVKGNLRLAHKAESDAELVVGRIIGESESGFAPVIPACVYTVPEIAYAGLTSAQCEGAGVEYFSSKALFGANGKAVASGAESGFLKLIFARVDRADSALPIPFYPEKSGEFRLVGVHILSESASEMIGGFALLIANGLNRKELSRAVFPHPSFSEAFKEALGAAASKK